MTEHPKTPSDPTGPETETTTAHNRTSTAAADTAEPNASANTAGAAPTADRKRRLTKGRLVALGSGIAIGVSAAGLGLLTYQVTNPPAEIESNLFGNRSVNFEDKPAISVAGGTIDSVTVKPVDGGKKVNGFVEDEGTRYTLDTTHMDFGTKYKVTAVATNARGEETVRSETFKTFAPDRFVATTVNVVEGETYGVGMPITVTFSEPVSDRAKIESLLKVSTAKGEVEGSWSWVDDTEVSYRPREYWPANTKVTVSGDIKGVKVGRGVAAEENINLTFKTGDRQIITVDSNTHQMVVRRNGKVVRTIPVSLGRPGDETRSGTKVLMSREQNVVFDAASLGVPEGDPDYYRLQIAYAMRLTWSGEYIHSAPWSVGAQGSYNVSHGCTNVSTENALWLFENTHVGDVVKFKNAGPEVEDGNGITVWNESWDEWQSGSALAAQQS